MGSSCDLRGTLSTLQNLLGKETECQRYAIKALKAKTRKCSGCKQTCCKICMEDQYCYGCDEMQCDQCCEICEFCQEYICINPKCYESRSHKQQCYHCDKKGCKQTLYQCFDCALFLCKKCKHENPDESDD